MMAMPFCENWARLLALRPADGRLRFLDVYLRAAFEGWTPSEDDSPEVQNDYWIIAPLIVEKVKKSSAGKAGGRPKKDTSKTASNMTGAFSGAFSGAFQRPKSAFQVLSAPLKEKKGKEDEEREISSHSLNQEYSSDVTSDAASESSAADQPLDECSSLDSSPSIEFVRAVAKQLEIEEAFGEYFFAEQSKLGWQALGKDGNTFPITCRNVAQILRNWWFKKNRDEKLTAPRADVKPLNGAGRAEITPFTSDESEVVE